MSVKLKKRATNWAAAGAEHRQRLINNEADGLVEFSAAARIKSCTVIKTIFEADKRGTFRTKSGDQYPTTLFCVFSFHNEEKVFVLRIRLSTNWIKICL